MANELSHIIRQICADRGVDPETLFVAIEQALLQAAKKYRPTVNELRVEIDRKTGEIHLYAIKTVVKAVADPENEMDLKSARKRVDENIAIGALVEDEIPAQDLGRIAAQTVKQIIHQKIRDAQRTNIFDQFKHKEGHLITGRVQRFDKEGVIADVEQTEALIPYRELPKNHGLHQGDLIKCLCMEVKSSAKGPQIILSRTHPDLVRLLFEQEVPEIADGVVTIQSVSREPGDRAKIAVSCSDRNVDPVGACVGMKGSRVQIVVRELKGEKVDIVPWSEDAQQYIANALNPAKILYAELDPENSKATVTVEENQLSLAIGKHGQNAKLASKLTGWNLDIIAEQTEDTSEENSESEEQYSEETTGNETELTLDEPIIEETNSNQIDDSITLPADSPDFVEETETEFLDQIEETTDDVENKEEKD